MDRIDWWPLMIHGSFAALGGLVRVLRSGGPARHWTEFVAGAVIGMFAGMVTYSLCRHWELSEYLTVALTGLAGYSGTPLLDLLAGLLRYRLARAGGVVGEDDLPPPARAGRGE